MRALLRRWKQFWRRMRHEPLRALSGGKYITKGEWCRACIKWGVNWVKVPGEPCDRCAHRDRGTL